MTLERFSYDNANRSENSSMNFWAKISDTIFTGAIVSGICYTLVSKYGKQNAFSEYLPYFIGSSILLPCVKYLNQSFIKSSITNLTLQFTSEEVALQTGNVVTHILQTSIASSMIVSAIRMLDIEKGLDGKDNCLHDILSKSIACGVLPKLFSKLSNGDIDNMSYDLLVSFTNQFVRKGIKGMLDDLRDDCWLPYKAEHKALGAVLGSVTKGLMINQKNMDIFQSVGFNIFNTFIYDMTSAKSYLKSGFSFLEYEMGFQQSEFANEVISTAILESSESYVDSLALYGVQELFNLD